MWGSQIHCNQSRHLFAASPGCGQGRAQARSDLQATVPTRARDCACSSMSHAEVFAPSPERCFQETKSALALQPCPKPAWLISSPLSKENLESSNQMPELERPCNGWGQPQNSCQVTPGRKNPRAKQSQVSLGGSFPWLELGRLLKAEKHSELRGGRATLGTSENSKKRLCRRHRWLWGHLLGGSRLGGATEAKIQQ